MYLISSRLGPFKRFTALWHLKLFLITYVLSSQSRGHAPGRGVKNKKKTESQWGTLRSLGSNVLMFIIKILLNGLTDWGQILRVVSSLSLECPKENIIRIWLVSSWCMFNRKKYLVTVIHRSIRATFIVIMHRIQLVKLRSY